MNSFVIKFSVSIISIIYWHSSYCCNKYFILYFHVYQSSKINILDYQHYFLLYQEQQRSSPYSVQKDTQQRFRIIKVRAASPPSIYYFSGFILNFFLASWVWGRLLLNYFWRKIFKNYLCVPKCKAIHALKNYIYSLHWWLHGREGRWGIISVRRKHILKVSEAVTIYLYVCLHNEL